jgi:hypothetical protein
VPSSLCVRLQGVAQDEKDGRRLTLKEKEYKLQYETTQLSEQKKKLEKGLQTLQLKLGHKVRASLFSIFFLFVQ